MNTILFDLDGTLLPMDNEIFEKQYFKILCIKLKDIIPPEEAVKVIWQATIEMAKNLDASKTNKDIFMLKFRELTGLDTDYMYNIFIEFYNNEFKDLKKLITPSQYIIDSVEVLKRKGYEMIVATNPLFPMDAIVERINWAGLKPEVFMLITSFEEMHFCKPQIKYYEEILKRAGKNSEDCLMVGNDAEEDLAAGKLGIKTFLIEDNILNKKGIVPEPDYKGNYKDFYDFVTNLPDLSRTTV